MSACAKKFVKSWCSVYDLLPEVKILVLVPRGSDVGGQCCRGLAVPVPEAVLVALVPLIEGGPGKTSVGLQLAVLVHIYLLNFFS